MASDIPLSCYIMGHKPDPDGWHYTTPGSCAQETGCLRNNCEGTATRIMHDFGRGTRVSGDAGHIVGDYVFECRRCPARKKKWLAP